MADQRTDREMAVLEIDLGNERQVRALCNEVRVARAELEEAVARVGTRWPAVKDFLQRRVASFGTVRGDTPGQNAAGLGNPGQHGERGIPQEGQAEQFATDMPRKVATGQDKQEQARPPDPALRE